MMDFLKELIAYLVILPAALLCFFPMVHQLKFSRKQILIRVLLLLAVLLPAVAWLTIRFSLNSNALTFPMLFLLYFAYQHSLKVPFQKSAAVFMLVCALMSFLANFATAFDAFLRPTAPPDTLGIQAVLFQLMLNLLLVEYMYFPFRKYGSRLIDFYNLNSVWLLAMAISGLFLVLNVAISPDDYQTLYVKDVFRAFLVTLSVGFILLLLFCAIFYYVVSSLLRTARIEGHNRLLEVQERQFISMKEYMEETARTRHDFKQTILTLQMLAHQKDFDALETYLDKYAESMPQNSIANYCRNNALNALLNSYASSAKKHHIDLELRVELPSILPVSDTDLCSMIGNILDNAIRACQNIPEEERLIELTITTRYETQFCIVATNTFDGEVRKIGGQYISTYRDGNGIGLTSIASTAEKYHGSASFSHSDREFYTDILIPISRDIRLANNAQ